MNSFDEAVYAHADKIAELVISKQRDYGKGNIVNTPFTPEMILSVRLYEKVARLANLIQTGATPSNETLEDTWQDIVGYAFVGLMVTDGSFNLPLESESGTRES